MSQSTKIQDARIWDGHGEGYLQADQVIIEDGRIAAIGNDLPSADIVISLGAKALLPGFIDAHFHAYAADVNVPRLEKLPISYLAHHARQSLEASLKRGFTTVRDAGGADWGLWKASEEGLFAGPRIFYAGRALSQTGGHGDPRDASFDPCGCRHKAILSEVVDGVDEARKAARETLRRGAHQIKIFVSGGVSSPTDPIWMPQFSSEEIRAIVDEARSRRSYVMAHAYTADAVIHAVGNGVRSIEHGNLIDEAAAELMAANRAFLVPTLIAYDSLMRRGRDLGLPESAYPKLAEVGAHGLKAIDIARKKGVQIGFGTDLLGPLQDDQLLEFKLRSAIEKPVDTLRSATSVNARLIGQKGQLGTVAVGALADLVAFDGDPLSDLRCVFRDGPSLVVSRGVLSS